MTLTTTLAASMTKTIPRTGRSQIRCNSAVSATIALPSASEPASPMKTRAGNQLKTRNDATTPASAAAIAATGMSERVTAMIVIPISTSDVHDAASPSTPSVRLTALLIATTAMATTTASPQPRFGAPRPGKNWWVKPAIVRPDADQDPGDPLQAELLPDGEPEALDLADVDDVVEATCDRAGDEREDRDEPLTRAVDHEPDHDRDDAEERSAESRRPLLGSMARRAVRGDVLARSVADEQPDERGIEQHAGHQREHPDDDRLSHGAIRQSLIIISAICFQIGAASSDPNLPVCVPGVR